MPRRLLLAICMIHDLPGPFSRNLWESGDAAGPGTMRALAIGSAQDWLMLNIVGHPVVQSGPLVFQTGGTFIHLFGQWLGPADASRLATVLFFFVISACIWYGAYLLDRRPEVQPFEFVFGDQSNTHDYGHTLTGGALLIFLAYAGLAQCGHETISLVGALCSVATTVHDLIRALDKPMHSSLVYGIDIGYLSLAGNPTLSSAIMVAILIAAHVARVLSLRSLLTIALSMSIILGCSWPAITYLLTNNPTSVVTYVRGWARSDRHQCAGPAAYSLGFVAHNPPLLAWLV